MTDFSVDPASGSRVGLSYIAEETWGTTPATPSMTLLRHKGASFQLNKQALESDEVREDRQVEFMRHGNKTVEGTLPFDLSYAAYDDLIASVLFGTWSSGAAGTPQTIDAGTTFSSVTLEQRWTDITQYRALTGMAVNSMSLTVQENQLVSGTFNMIGKSTGDITSTPLDSSPSASPSNEPMDSFTGTISEGGSEIATVTGLELTLENGLNARHVVGSANPATLDIGRSRLSGTLTAFFLDEVLYNKFVNETESSLEFELIDAADSNLTLKFTIPRIKYNGGNIGQETQARLAVALPFVALYDTASSTNITITRSNPE